MLIGLGVDYGIHWFARLEEEEQDPELSSQEVILRVAARSGPGILMAAVSAACAFLPLILTGFTGLAELGLISGVGILCSVLADLSVLPLLSLPAKRRQRAAQRPTTSDTADLLAFTRRGAAWALAGAGSLCLLSLWSGWRVGFDANPLHLQARGTESVAWAERLRQHATRSVIFAAIVADSAEEVAAKTAALEILPEVWKVQSVFTLLPAHQEDKIPLLRAALTDLDAMGRGPSASPPPDPGTLVQLLERLRFKVDEEQADRWGAQRPLIDQMRQVRALTAEILEALHRAAPGNVAALGAYQWQFQEGLGDVFDLLAQGATASPMRLADLPTPLRDRFLLQGHYLIQIYPREDVWDWAPRDRFVQAIRHVDPQVMGAVVTLHVFTGAFLKASVQAALYALIALFGLLLLTFRAWRLACLALIPLVVGTLWTVGSMGLIGLQFNVANTIFLPLIVGAGVEYGIIILYRWQEGRMQPGHLPLSTGKGVILATLTTTIGFGSLMLCRYRGTFSLGVLAFVGSLFVLAATLVLMPASMAFLTPPQLSLEKEERTI